MNFGTEFGFCTSTATFWQEVGYFLLIFKIVLPIMLIVVGIISLGKAIISDDSKDMKKAVNSLVKKFLVAAFIFFLPTLITTCFGIVSGFDELKSDYKICEKCIAHPKSEYCNKKVLAINEDA